MLQQIIETILNGLQTTNLWKTLIKLTFQNFDNKRYSKMWITLFSGQKGNKWTCTIRTIYCRTRKKADRVFDIALYQGKEKIFPRGKQDHFSSFLLAFRIDVRIGKICIVSFSFWIVFSEAARPKSLPDRYLKIEYLKLKLKFWLLNLFI